MKLLGLGTAIVMACAIPLGATAAASEVSVVGPYAVQSSASSLAPSTTLSRSYGDGYLHGTETVWEGASLGKLSIVRSKSYVCGKTQFEKSYRSDKFSQWASGCAVGYEFLAHKSPLYNVGWFVGWQQVSLGDATIVQGYCEDPKNYLPAVDPAGSFPSWSAGCLRGASDAIKYHVPQGLSTSGSSPTGAPNTRDLYLKWKNSHAGAVTQLASDWQPFIAAINSPSYVDGVVDGPADPVIVAGLQQFGDGSITADIVAIVQGESPPDYALQTDLQAMFNSSANIVTNCPVYYSAACQTFLNNLGIQISTFMTEYNHDNSKY